MGKTRFSVNGFMLVAIVFAALLLFFSLVMVDKADRRVVGEYYPIEGTKLGIRYTTLEPSGLCEGSRNTAVLKVEGTFGHDWGMALEGDALYVNEYTVTDLGITMCKLVRIDLGTYEKTTVLNDALLRGRCASGELVCMEGAFLPVDRPEENPLCRLYRMSEGAFVRERQGTAVLFLDPGTGRVLRRVWDENAYDDDFETRWINRTMEEAAP